MKIDMRLLSVRFTSIHPNGSLY